VTIPTGVPRMASYGGFLLRTDNFGPYFSSPDQASPDCFSPEPDLETTSALVTFAMSSNSR
jgi:hypothetical protein